MTRTRFPLATTRPSMSSIVPVVILAMIVYVIALPPSAASMAGITVNSTVDSIDAVPGDGNCADSLGRCTLRAAVMEANASSGANTITLPAGTYTLTIGPYDNEFNFGEGATETSGDIDVQNNDLTITGAGAATTIIDGGGIDRVFDVNNAFGSGVALNFTLQNLTVRNGNAPETPEGYFEAGGAIQFDGTNFSGPNTTLTITNSRIINSTAAGLGGGIFATSGSVNISGSEISGNTTTNANGGGMVYDGPLTATTLQVTTSTIKNNDAPNSIFGSGGGLWVGGGTSKNIRYNSITNNHAGAKGGGVFNGNNSLSMNYNVIVGNTASGDASSTGFRNNAGTTAVDNNWWGCNQGPGSAPCNRASGPSGFGITQWLFLNHKATPNSILVNTSTTLQADFYNNNLGTIVLPTDLVALEGRAVLFNNAVLGTISAADTQISNGKANAIYTAGATGGTGSADATVDQATVTATININQAPGVTVNPTDQTACDGSSVTFTAASSGFPPPTVQWQVSTGGPFTDIPGATSNTLTFTATISQNGNKYRAVFTNAGGTDTTTAATLTVITAPTITQNPSNVTTCAGGTATFTAAASNSTGVQWEVSTNGGALFTPIPGANSTTLSFTASSSQNGNQYRAVFSNSCGNTPTSAATLTIQASTTTSDPSDATVCQGATANFSTTAGGTGPFSYAWTVDGSAAGTNSPSLSVNTTSLSVGNHTVSVTTTGTCGSASQSATLTVQANTTTSDPPDQTVCQGATASFSTTAGGTGPFHYAWTVDGSAFGGDTSSINVPTGSMSIGAHTVTVTTTGTCGSASQSATLTVNANTTTTDPSDATVCQGATANFSTTAGGTGPFSYAWTVDGSAAGTNSPSLSVDTTSLSVGNHTVSVTTTGTCGSASQSATLTVQATTSTTDPPDQTVCQGATASFSTTASGTGPFHYAWTVDGSAFGGDTSSINVPTGSMSVGNHTVTVTTTGTCGSASQSATLTVNANTATSDPPDVATCEGATASFTTNASGTGPFSFVWKKGAVPIVSGGRFTITNGSTSSTLTITNVQAGDAGSYTVETTGACGTATQSANLSVDSTPPTIILNGNTITLWPPNHQYHTINVADLVSGVSDSCDNLSVNDVTIASVTSDEVENSSGADGNTLNDIVISCDRHSVQLRAERDGNLDGRVYTITFSVTDSQGHVGTATAKVTVPVNQNGAAAIDSGPHYAVATATCP